MRISLAMSHGGGIKGPCTDCGVTETYPIVTSHGHIATGTKPNWPTKKDYIITPASDQRYKILVKELRKSSLS